VRAEKRAVDRRILVDDEWRFVGHVGPPFSLKRSLSRDCGRDTHYWAPPEASWHLARAALLEK
jgi:hypothetical protein